MNAADGTTYEMLTHTGWTHVRSTLLSAHTVALGLRGEDQPPQAISQAHNLYPDVDELWGWAP